MNQALGKLIFLAIATGLASPAAASEWWYVAHEPDRVLFVDQQSIRRDGPVVHYWTLLALEIRGHRAGETKAYMRADCSTQEIGWLASADYDRNDAQGPVSTRPEADAEMAKPERDTLDQAQLSFVCNAGFRVLNHLFPIAIDEVTFTRAVLRAGSALNDPRALHDTMVKDRTVPIIRSTAPDTATFGQVQTVRRGEPIVPPRDYHTGPQVPRSADYDPDTVGVIYDVAYQGLKDAAISFEVRGYSGDDMVHPGSGQIESTPVGSTAITLRDLAVTIIKATPETLTYRVRIQRALAPEDCTLTCGAATSSTEADPQPARRSVRK